MALKGKKKKGRRGSQARRRPASAPRPTAVARRRPWYQTTRGRTWGSIAALAVIGLIAWAVTNQSSEASRLEERQEALDTYTGQVRTVLQTLTPPVGEMAGASTIPPEELAATAKAWDKGFSGAQKALSQANPPTDVQPVNALLLRSILMYVQAADTYELVPELEGDAREKLLSQAGVQVQNADAVFASAVAVLDQARLDADLSASNLESPSTSAPPAGPETTPGTETQTDTETIGGGGGGGSGGGSKGGGGGTGKGDGGKKKSGKGDG